MRSQIIWADSYVWWNDAFWLRVKERCPKKWLMISVWLSPGCLSPSLSASRPSHTDSTCLILAHHSLTRLRWPVISWLDHRRPEHDFWSCAKRSNSSISSHTYTYDQSTLLEYYLFLTNQSNRPNRPSPAKLWCSSALSYYARKHHFYT